MPRTVEAVGDCEAVIEVQPPGVASLYWQDARGRQLKNAPARIAKAHRGQCRAVKDKLKAIRNTLRVQTRRIESFYLDGTAMAFADWRRYFAEHTLMKTVARSLIWRFTGTAGSNTAMLRDGTLMQADGSELPLPADTAQVQLWHPLHDDTQTRDAWRNAIWQNAVAQPFRQAYREIYRAADVAEINKLVSGLYVRQHQLRALLLQREWRYQLHGNFESESLPTLALSDGLRCEIGIGRESRSISGRGISLAVELGGIRFLRGFDEVAADTLPPVVCSEILRDVDLFATAAGIGYRCDWEDVEAVAEELAEVELLKSLADAETGTADGLLRLLEREPAFSALAQLMARLDAAMGGMPLPASVRMRGELLQRLLQQSPLEQCALVDGRCVQVDTPQGQYRINLASGLMFNAADNSLQGSVAAQPQADLAGEPGGDILLARIYSTITQLCQPRQDRSD